MPRTQGLSVDESLAISRLRELDAHWSAYLESEACPPVIGLAPLFEADSHAIQQLVSILVDRPQRLFRLIEEFPACMAVWLARKAGEAYDAGAFWDKFGELIHISVPLNLREELVRLFRKACRTTMSSWLPPEELGGQYLVAEFLYQAGLPLDRCERFAQHVRKVERLVGLPDPDAPDAGRQLREAMIESLQGINVPTLKRALRGAAGSRICEVALSVVLKGDFTGINPRLGQELERVFANAERGTLRRAMHQPFLRLGDDYGSLEINCPRQDSTAIGATGLVWVVNGVRTPTPRHEELVIKVTDEPRVSVEMMGLAGAPVPPRSFALRLSDRAEPFILFDDRNRRERRASGPIPAGSYWLLHRTSESLVGCEQSYEWPDGERVLSSFHIRPGSAMTLSGSRGGSWTFSCTASPFFDAAGEYLTHESREAIWFRWTEPPVIWIPVEHADIELLTEWRVSVSGVDADQSWSLSRTTEEAGGMVKCKVMCGAFWASLPPAIYRLRFALTRLSRTRTEASAEYLFWSGLNASDLHGFHLASLPRNIVQSECRGFDFGPNTISHKRDQNRRHTLAFDLTGAPVMFHWSQPGIFAETVERKAGEPSLTRSHRLGEAFSVTLDSARWLRVWFSGETSWEILVAGQAWQRAVHCDRREFVELSFASLAIAHPGGGAITLRIGQRDLLVARFTSPMHALAANSIDSGSQRGIQYQFPEPIDWVRPSILNLCTGQTHNALGGQFESSETLSFAVADLPPIQCLRTAGCGNGGVNRKAVALLAPKLQWPGGLWLIDLEVRRDAESEWESVLINGRERSPLVFRAPEMAPSSRSSLIWKSLSPSIQDWDVVQESVWTEDLLGLLIDLMALRKREYSFSAREEMGWLKDSVRSLSQLAGRLARNPEHDGFLYAILDLACQDPDHAGFVYLPVLLARPASEYCELPAGDPLNDSLRRCGKIAVTDSIARLVKEDFTFFDVSVLSCFRNFAVVAQSEAQSFTDFQQFSFDRYWEEVIGTLYVPRLAPDWSGDSLLLGKSHSIWTIAELARRYERAGQTVNVAAANVLLHCAEPFRHWLASRLAASALVPGVDLKEPWLRVQAPEADFLESAPKFASLFALAARASAAGFLEFSEAQAWLEAQVPRRYMAEEGVAALVGLAPELFGHQLLFWELVVRTAQD